MIVNAIYLDLAQLSLLLSKTSLLDLRMSKNSDDGRKLLDSVELTVEEVLLLSVCLGVLGESLLL